MAASNCVSAAAKSASLTPGGTLTPRSCSRLGLPQVFWPDAIAARRENPVRVHCIFHGFVKTQQRVIVEGICIHHRTLMSGSRAVFTPAVFRRDLHQPLERRAISLVRLDIVRDRKTEKIDETSLPVARRKAKRWNGQVQFLGGVGEDTIGFEDRLACPRNDRGKPDVPVSRGRVRLRPRADRKHSEAWYSELRHVHSFP